MINPEDNSNFNGDSQSPEFPSDSYNPGQEDSNYSEEFPTTGDTDSATHRQNGSELNFPSMEEDVAAFRRELDAIKFSPIDPSSAEDQSTSSSQSIRRRRRSSRTFDRPSASEIGSRLDTIFQNSSPSIDFFIFSFLSGCVIALGYLIDSPAILLMGILLAPLLSPWVGIALSAATGEFRVFKQLIGGAIISLVMVFGAGLLAGVLSHWLPSATNSQVQAHARLWGADLLMLVIGSSIQIISFIRSDKKPVIASLMVAYELFLPVSAAGFGLFGTVKGIWPEAGMIFLIHLMLMLIISLVIFFYMGFRPLEITGYAMPVGLSLLGLVVLAGFAGLGSIANTRGNIVTPSMTELMTQTPAAIASGIDLTVTPTITPTQTLTPTLSPQPTATTSLLTLTPQPEPSPGKGTVIPTLVPTPVYGKVQSASGGVLVRYTPNGVSFTSAQNGYLVEILGDKPVLVDNQYWVHVIIKTQTHDIDGWVLLEMIVTATPSFTP